MLLLQEVFQLFSFRIGRRLTLEPCANHCPHCHASAGTIGASSSANTHPPSSVPKDLSRHIRGLQRGLCSAKLDSPISRSCHHVRIISARLQHSPPLHPIRPPSHSAVAFLQDCLKMTSSSRIMHKKQKLLCWGSQKLFLLHFYSPLFRSRQE